MDKRNTKQITLFSDSAPGQNKNYLIVQFGMWLANTFGVCVYHIFPVRGHSYCVCDRNFSIYSRKVKKHANIHTAKGYIQIMKEARVKQAPFTVVYGESIIRNWEPLFWIRNFQERLYNVRRRTVDSSPYSCFISWSTNNMQLYWHLCHTYQFMYHSYKKTA